MDLEGKPKFDLESVQEVLDQANRDLDIVEVEENDDEPYPLPGEDSSAQEPQDLGQEAELPEEDEEEDEPEESVVKDNKPKKKRNRVPANKKIAQLVQKTHSLEQELEELRSREKAYAKQLQETQVHALTERENAIRTHLSQAQGRLKEAIEDGDAQEQAEASVWISQLTAEAAEMRRIKNTLPQHSDDSPSPPPNYGRESASSQPNLAQEWLQTNSWFNPQSEDFDYARHAETREFIEDYERSLHESGQAYLIGKRPYFKAINKFIEESFEQEEAPLPPPAPVARRSPFMNTGQRNPVAPVASRPGSAIGSPAKTSVTLTPGMRKQIAQVVEATGLDEENAKKLYAHFVGKHKDHKLLKNRR